MFDKFKFKEAPDDISVNETNRVVKAGVPVSVWKPAWDDTVYIETCFRAVGPLASPTEIIPSRYSSAEDDFTEWIIKVPIFIGGMKTRVFMVATARDNDSTCNPITKFMGAMSVLTRTDKVLYATVYTPSAGTRIAPLSKKIAMWAFIQGIIVNHPRLKNGPRWNSLLMLSKSAWTALCNKLNEKDAAGNLVIPDIIHADTGRLMKFYNPATKTAATARFAESLLNTAKVTTGSDVRTISRYECDITDVAPLPRDASGHIINGSTLFYKWSDIIHIPTEQEMVETLCDVFEELGPRVLSTALSGYAQWLPKFVKGDVISTPTTSNIAQNTAQPKPASILWPTTQSAAPETSTSKVNPLTASSLLSPTPVNTTNMQELSDPDEEGLLITPTPVQPTPTSTNVRPLAAPNEQPKQSTVMQPQTPPVKAKAPTQPTQQNKVDELLNSIRKSRAGK